jgi:RNA polymerase sigma-70 factor (ECF subfamily)
MKIIRIPQPLESILISREQAELLAAALEKLPDDEKLLLIGKYILGEDDAALSKQLNCAAGSVRMKLTRARRRAMKIMKEMEAMTDAKCSAGAI